MENTEKTERFTLMEIIIIACLISVIFSPAGIILMWIKCKWSKKLKLILTGAFALLYILIALLVAVFNSSGSGGSGNNMPDFGIESDAGGSGGGGKVKENKKSSKSYKPATQPKPSSSNSEASGGSVMQKVKKSRLTYLILFLVVIAVVVVLRNLKFKKTKKGDNPYVDSELYVFPIPDQFTFPPVRYTKLDLQPEEKILFACPAETKDNPGDIVITDKRFEFHGKKGDVKISIENLSAIASMSNTALSVTAEDKTHYFFVKDTQMRFVLQIVRWAYAQQEKIPGNVEIQSRTVAEDSLEDLTE